MSADLTKKKMTFSVAINQKSYKDLIARTISDKKAAARFTSSIISAVSATPALQECSPASIVSGALLGESLGLSPSPQLGQFYLVPFKDKKTGVPKAQFILGAKGYKQLAIRSNQYKNLGVTAVRQGEYKGRDRFSGDPVIEFNDDMSAPIVGYYAFFELLTGFRKCIYWTKEKMMEHADRYSPAFSKLAYDKLQRGEIPERDMWKYSSFWYKDFDKMAEKTMIRQLLSQWGILSPEMRNAFESDEQEITYDNTNDVFVAEEPQEEVIDIPDESVNEVEEEPEEVNLNEL